MATKKILIGLFYVNYLIVPFKATLNKKLKVNYQKSRKAVLINPLRSKTASGNSEKEILCYKRNINDEDKIV